MNHKELKKDLLAILGMAKYAYEQQINHKSMCNFTIMLQQKQLIERVTEFIETFPDTSNKTPDKKIEWVTAVDFDDHGDGLSGILGTAFGNCGG